MRERRLRARYSQMDLAFDIGISPRHLSFVELGKSRPSPELLLAIATHLGVPPRERNEWLLAAGHAPRYPHSSLDAPALAQVRASLQELLDAHDPCPAVAVDRCWNIQLANRAAGRLTASLPEHLRAPAGTCGHLSPTSSGSRSIPTDWRGAAATSPTGRRTCCATLS